MFIEKSLLFLKNSLFFIEKLFRSSFSCLFSYFSLAETLRDIMEWILFFQISTCAIAIAFSLFVLENTLSFETYIALLDLYATLELVFSYSYIAQRIIADLLKIGNIMYDSPWYRLPTKQQKLLTLSIRRAERELRFKCLGIFDCSLEGFAKVIIYYYTLTLVGKAKRNFLIKRIF